MIDSDGHIVKTFSSLREAAREIGKKVQLDIFATCVKEIERLPLDIVGNTTKTHSNKIIGN